MTRLFNSSYLATVAASLMVLIHASAFAGGSACGANCSGDVGGDGSVDVDDLIDIILSWGPCPVPCPPACAQDVAPAGAPDCAVNVDDLIAVILGWGPCPTLANDGCAAPTYINIHEGSLLTVPFCTATATTDGPAEPSCNFCCGDQQIHKDIWFTFSTSIFGGNYTLHLDTCGSGFDTKVAVYRTADSGGCLCPGAGATLVACNDDSGLDGCALQSRVQVQLAPSSCYLFRIGGYNGESGVGQMRIGFFWNADECFNATYLGQVTAANPLSAFGNNFPGNQHHPGLTVPQAPCTPFPDGVDIWYRFQIGCGGNVLGGASTCNDSTNFDTILTLYHGTCDGLTLIDCSDDETLPQCQLNGLPRKSIVDLPVDAEPGDYYLRVSGYNGAAGQYQVTVGLGCVN